MNTVKLMAVTAYFFYLSITLPLLLLEKLHLPA